MVVATAAASVALENLIAWFKMRESYPEERDDRMD